MAAADRTESSDEWFLSSAIFLGITVLLLAQGGLAWWSITSAAATAIASIAMLVRAIIQLRLERRIRDAKQE